MKIKKGFVLREVCGEHIVVASGIENIDFNKVVAMNETASCVWQAVVNKESFTIDDMVKAVISEYEIDEETARKDCEALAEQWIEAEIAV